jgi:hypothetical protein
MARIRKGGRVAPRGVREALREAEHDSSCDGRGLGEAWDVSFEFFARVLELRTLLRLKSKLSERGRSQVGNSAPPHLQRELSLANEVEHRVVQCQGRCWIFRCLRPPQEPYQSSAPGESETELNRESEA